MPLVRNDLHAGRSPGHEAALGGFVQGALHNWVEVRREDVVVSLVEVGREDWSFGNGAAQTA